MAILLEAGASQTITPTNTSLMMRISWTSPYQEKGEFVAGQGFGSVTPVCPVW